MLEEKLNITFQHDRTSSFVENEVTTFMNRQFPEHYFGLEGTNSCSLLPLVLRPLRIFFCAACWKCKIYFPPTPGTNRLEGSNKNECKTWTNFIAKYLAKFHYLLYTRGKGNSLIRTLQWHAFSFCVCKYTYLPMSLCNRSNTRVNISHIILICPEDDDALFL
jgi:hypothetical protein